MTNPTSPSRHGQPPWHSWHVHLDTFAREAADTALTQVIGPAVDLLGADPLWFFVRYWQRGPQLRLRCRTHNPMAVDTVLRARFAALPTTPAAHRLDASRYRTAVARTAATGEWGVPLPVEEFRTPGVYRETYRPEHHRYGGPALMPRSEDVFHASSRAALDLVRARKDNGPVLVEGLRALTAVVACLLPYENEVHPHEPLGPPHSLAALRTWLSRALAISASFLPPADPLTALRERARHAGPQLARSGGLLAAPLTGTDPVLAPLTAVSRQARAAWCAAERAGRSTVSADAILGSHLHMTANRLGLTGTPELYLMTLLESACTAYVTACASAEPSGRSRDEARSTQDSQGS